MDKLIETIDSYVKKAPALPANAKETLVKIAPWLSIASIVLSLPLLTAAMGFSSMMGVYGLGLYQVLGPQYYLSVAVLAASLVLQGLAVPGLFAKTKAGWMFMFYGSLVYIVYSVFSGQIVNGLISAAISLYLLFQVREFYK